MIRPRRGQQVEERNGRSEAFLLYSTQSSNTKHIKRRKVVLYPIRYCIYTVSMDRQRLQQQQSRRKRKYSGITICIVPIRQYIIHRTRHISSSSSRLIYQFTIMVSSYISTPSYKTINNSRRGERRKTRSGIKCCMVLIV